LIIFDQPPLAEYVKRQLTFVLFKFRDVQLLCFPLHVIQIRVFIEQVDCCSASPAISALPAVSNHSVRFKNAFGVPRPVVALIITVVSQRPS